MNDQSQRSSPATSPAAAKSTCSPASAAGRSHSGSPAGRTTSQSGQGAAPVNRSASPGLGPEQMTIGIFGPTSTGSSASAGLQRSLESRLLRRLDVHGSLEYALTWKRQAMPSGPPICRLRASARRTSGKGFGGWHTPTAVDAKGRTYTYDGHDKTKPRLSNEGLIKGYPAPRADKAGWPTPMAGTPAQKGYNEAGDTCNSRKTKHLVGWATPMERDWRSGKVSDEVRDRNSRPLNEQVELAKGWPTPRSAFLGNDANAAVRHQAVASKKGSHDRPGKTLDVAAQMAQKGWGTPRATDGMTHKNPSLAEQPRGRLEDQALGTTTSGSPASTAPTGALNPAFTRWLIGFPEEWDACAPTATRSRRRSPQSL